MPRRPRSRDDRPERGYVARVVGEGHFEVSGAWYGWRIPTLAVALLGGGLALGSVLALTRLNLPWMLPPWLVEHPLVAPVAFVFAAGFAAGLVKPFFMARAGRVTLSPEGVQWRGRFRSFTAWSEVEAYSDALPTTVRLVRRGKSAPSHKLAIPTRGEEARVAVLRALDARGLRRVEAPPREMWLWRGIATGLLAVAAFVLVLDRVNARYRRLLDIETGASTPTEESAAFLSDCATACRLALRASAGTEDEILINGTYDFASPAGLFVPEARVDVHESCRTEVDGAVVGSMGPAHFYYTLGTPRPPLMLQVIVPRRTLAPGRHAIRVVTQVRVGDVCCEKVNNFTVEIVSGSIAAQTVRLVRGSAPSLEVAAFTHRGVYPYFSCEHLEHALAMDVAILESGTSIARGLLIETKGPIERGALWGLGHGGPVEFTLPSGQHVLEFRFTPDASVAFENSVEITEIYGEPFEKELVVDVK